jgi:hypothetical protein
MTNQQIDPTEKAYGRMHELLRESEEQERVILTKISNLKQRVYNLRALADPNDRNPERYNAAMAEAHKLDAEVICLTTVDLPRLRMEREPIRTFRTLELSRMMLAANHAAEKAKADHKRSFLDNLTDARSALDENLNKLATAETFRLAQAVADAALAMGIGENLGASIELIDSSVPALLLERDSRKAAA